MSGGGESGWASNPSRVPTQLVAALLALCLALSACGGNAATGAAEDPGVAGEVDQNDDGKGGESGKNAPGSGKKRSREGDGKSQGAGPGGQGPAGGVAVPSRSRPGLSSVRDAIGDQERDGDVPAWVDLTGGVLRDTGGALVARATFASPPPPRMPDESHVAQVAVHLKVPKGTAYLYAEGRPDGWRAYVSRNKKSTELPPGSFSIVGREMSWTVPWGALGDPRRLDWALYLSWTETTLLRVNYAFDSAPDSGTERLRRR